MNKTEILRMKKPNKKLLSLGLLFIIVFIFFYKTLLKGLLPFPGDLLLSGYGPWRHVSYNGYVAGAIPSKDQYFDVIRELYPWKTLVINQLKKGIMPLWNPYNFSGAPLLANYQSQVFYPPALLYFVLPQIVAWTILVILQPLLGSVFMYLFATEIGLSSGAAILAAILFNFSSFASVWMEFNTVWNTILWLPLLLYLFEKSLRKKCFSFGAKIVFIFALFSSITAGHPQDFINTFGFFAVYVLLRIVILDSLSKKEKIYYLAREILPITALPFLLALPQLLPTIELFKNSARVSHEYQNIIHTMLIQWWQIPLVVVQEFFGNPATKTSIFGDYVGKTLSIGVTGFVLVIAGLFQKFNSWHKKFFLATALFVLLITVSSPITRILYLYPLPIMSTGNPTRILFLLMLSLSVLAGFGFDVLRKQHELPIKAILFVLGIFVVIGLFAFFHPTVGSHIFIPAELTVMKRALLLSGAIAVVALSILLIRKFELRITYLLIPLAIAELFYSFYKFNPFVPAPFVYPENPLFTFIKNDAGINRFWGYGTAAIEANFATEEKVYSPDGTDPLNLKWYNEFLQSSKDGKIVKLFTRTTRSDALLASGYGAEDLPSNKYRFRVMDLLGIKYVIDRDENPRNNNTFPIDRFKPVWKNDGWTVYENLKAAPRIFLTRDVNFYSTSDEFEKKFFAPDFDPSQTILVESQNMNMFRNVSGSAGTVKLIDYEPNKIVINVQTAAPQALFISDTYDTGWSAKTEQNIHLPIIKADYAFRSIVIPAGNHTITFSYDPASYNVGVTISLITLLGLTGYAIYKTGSARVRHLRH